MHVTGESIAILDADISVEPFELKNFFEIIDNRAKIVTLTCSYTPAKCLKFFFNWC